MTNEKLWGEGNMSRVGMMNGNDSGLLNSAQDMRRTCIRCSAESVSTSLMTTSRHSLSWAYIIFRLKEVMKSFKKFDKHEPVRTFEIILSGFAETRREKYAYTGDS